MADGASIGPTNHDLYNECAAGPAQEFAVLWTQHGEKVVRCIKKSREELEFVRHSLQSLLHHYHAKDRPPVEGVRPRPVITAAKYVAGVRQQAARIKVNIKPYNLEKWGAIRTPQSFDMDIFPEHMPEHMPEPHARHFARVKRAQASEAFMQAIADDLENACDLYNPYLVAHDTAHHNDLERIWSTVEESIKQINKFLQDQ